MKPILSVNGSVELGLGAALAVAGVSWLAFPERGAPSPFEGPGVFVSGVLFAAGIMLAGYGYCLRKVWPKTIDDQVANLKTRRPGVRT